MRAYDIRGIVGDTLNGKDAYYLGYKFSCFTSKNGKPSRVVVGYDGRLSSKSLHKHLLEGLINAGSTVTSSGFMSTLPLLYSASIEIANSDGAIMNHRVL